MSTQDTQELNRMTDNEAMRKVFQKLLRQLRHQESEKGLVEDKTRRNIIQNFLETEDF
jgi:hypothetical protein